MNKAKTILFVILFMAAVYYFCGFLKNEPKYAHTFIFNNKKYKINIKTLTLAGDFNHWEKDGSALRDSDGDSIWQVTVNLKPGWHYYRFVLNGEIWLRDWDNPQYGAGHSNSMVFVDTLPVPRLSYSSPAEGSWLYSRQDTLKLGFDRSITCRPDLHISLWLDGKKRKYVLQDSILLVVFDPDIEGERRWRISLQKDTHITVYRKEGIFFVNLKNQSPQAQAGYTHFARLNDMVQLDGGLSFDPDFEPCRNFVWRQISGAERLDLSNEKSPFPRITARRSGKYRYELSVRDAAAVTSRDTTEVIILPDQRRKTVFELHSKDFRERIYKAALVGEFNQWNKKSTPFVPNSDSTYWRAEIFLPAGQYEYKFVLNNKKWALDPRNPNTVPDGWNGRNCLIKVSKQTPGGLMLGGLRRPISGHHLQITLKSAKGGKVHWFSDVQNKGKSYRAADTSLYFDEHNPPGVYFYYAIKEENGAYSKPLTLMIRHAKQTAVMDFSASPAWVDTAIVYEIYVRTFSASGDLAGVIRRLPYLKKLGVNTLWLMPVYEGPSTHGYAPTDLFAIEKDYGTLRDYRRLITTAHQKGMRIIFDFVANHFSDQHRFVRAAADNVRSPLRQWFYWQKDGRWGYHNDWDTLVNLNYHDPQVRHRQLQAAAFWAAQGVDGFRCDVAWAVPHDFWKDFRRKVKIINEEIVLIDEVLPRQPSFHDDEFDMSYDTDFYGTLLDVMNGRKPISALDYNLQKTRYNYPPYAQSLRYLENHDLERFLKQFGPGKTKIAAALLFTISGTPLIYQGQEQGCLQMRPNFPIIQDRKWFDFYHSLIKLRKKHKAFTLGRMQTIDLNDAAGFWEFRRTYGAEEFHVLINLSDKQKEINISARQSTLYYKNDGLLREKGRSFIKPLSFIIYKKGEDDIPSRNAKIN